MVFQARMMAAALAASLLLAGGALAARPLLVTDSRSSELATPFTGALADLPRLEPGITALSASAGGDPYAEQGDGRPLDHLELALEDETRIVIAAGPEPGSIRVTVNGEEVAPPQVKHVSIDVSPDIVFVDFPRDAPPTAEGRDQSVELRVGRVKLALTAAPGLQGLDVRAWEMGAKGGQPAEQGKGGAATA